MSRGRWARGREGNYHVVVVDEFAAAVPARQRGKQDVAFEGEGIVEHVAVCSDVQSQELTIGTRTAGACGRRNDATLLKEPDKRLARVLQRNGELLADNVDGNVRVIDVDAQVRSPSRRYDGCDCCA